jgi:hypothetical protein
MDMFPEVSTRINESAKGESGIGPRHPAYSKDSIDVGPGRAWLVVVGDSVVIVPLPLPPSTTEEMIDVDGSTNGAVVVEWAVVKDGGVEGV